MSSQRVASLSSIKNWFVLYEREHCTCVLQFRTGKPRAADERESIQKRTLVGLEVARAWGRKGGKPKATETMKPRNLALAKERSAAKEKSTAEIMEQTGFKSRGTFSTDMVNTAQ